jgi:hypothetical protein
VKTGCLWALVTWVCTIAVLALGALIAAAIWPIRFNPERVGDISSRIGLFLGLVTFVVVWIRQANRRERQPPKPTQQPPTTPEKLKPIDYSELSHLYDDDPKASDQNRPSA